MFWRFCLLMSFQKVFFACVFHYLCVPGGWGGKRIRPQCRRPRFNPSVRKIPWRRAWQSAPVFLPEEFHGQRSLARYNPWFHRVRHDWATNFHFHICITDYLTDKNIYSPNCYCFIVSFIVQNIIHKFVYF